MARLVLAAVFVFSAVAKLRDRPGSRRAVTDFGVPARAAGVVAAGLPVVELACAALLVSADPAATLGALASLILLASFTVMIVVNILRGNLVDCHCFGQVGGGSVGWPTVARNCALAVLAGLGLVGSGSLGSVPTVIASFEGTEMVLGVVAVPFAVLVSLLVLAGRALVRRYGEVLLRLEALEMGAGSSAPQPAPGFALSDLDGKLVTLGQVLEQQRPVLVVFISPTCALCSQLTPDLAAWQRDREHPIAVVIISDGTPEANRAKFLADSSAQILLQQKREVAVAYKVAGTPAAFLLGVDGLFASRSVYGVPAVRELHAGAFTTVTGAPAPAVPSQKRTGPRSVSVGDPVPDVEVVLDDGRTVPIAEIVKDDAVLLFWRSTCGFCASIVDRVAAFESQVNLMIVTETPTEELRASGLTSVVVHDPVRDLNASLRVPGTPAALRVRHGTVATPLAVGGPGVLALLAEVASADSLAH